MLAHMACALTVAQALLVPLAQLGWHRLCLCTWHLASCPEVQAWLHLGLHCPEVQAWLHLGLHCPEVQAWLQAWLHLAYRICIYVLVCSCAYTCTEKVDLIQKCNSEVDLVQSLNHNFYHNFYHKFDHTCGLGVQGKLSWRTWHYPQCTGEAIVAYLALSKGGYRVHYPRVATIQGWIWGPLSQGGHYPRVATVQESTCSFQIDFARSS